ncbi:MAG: 2-C-methyl-D-erythritol 2,4-cyclodiphosphate synthase [Fimbriimonadaceae bacterium]
MKFCGIVLAAGTGTRFGGDKLWKTIGGEPVWLRSWRALSAPPVEAVGLVVPAGSEPRFAALAPGAAFIVAGGETRTQSLAKGIGALPAGFDAVLIHDAARPFCPSDVVARVAAGVESNRAAYPVVPAVDTVRMRTARGTSFVDRDSVLLAQTPQGAMLDDLRQAVASGEATDEAAMLEAIGIHAIPVEGDPVNKKITFAEDLHSLSETRVGIGYDSHRFSDDPKRPLWLGGIKVPGRGLAGHSDADAVLHAITDAILGAAAMGDIGEHFPDTDPRWSNARSGQFLAAARQLIAADGWYIVSTDVTVIAESPKLAPYRVAMRAAIAECLGLDPSQIGLKATTNEQMGSIGRGEGIACMAVATIARTHV